MSTLREEDTPSYFIINSISALVTVTSLSFYANSVSPHKYRCVVWLAFIVFKDTQTFMLRTGRWIVTFGFYKPIVLPMVASVCGRL